ncbi:MAG TPA: response regulator [Verrucomicrobiae bacterium]|nr:response regulator [Verrucomicrobiae bacterium]
MKILIAEDDVTNRLVLESMLAPYGTVQSTLDGQEAVNAVETALSSDQPYDLICLDIMMPKKDGRSALGDIRQLEEKKGLRLGHGAKIIMTTCLSDSKNILGSFGQQCDGYIVKPVEKDKLVQLLWELELVAAQ